MSERLFLPVAVGANCNTTHWVCECVRAHIGILQEQLCEAEALLGNAATILRAYARHEEMRTYSLIVEYLKKRRKEYGRCDGGHPNAPDRSEDS